MAIESIPRAAPHREGNAAQVLSQVCLARLAETVDAETTEIADINRVRVIFENLLLGELLFQVKSDQGLRNLAAPAPLWSQPQRARRLLGERGRALAPAPIFQVYPGGSQDADRIEAGVLEEMFIFGREHGVHHDLRNIVEVNDPAFLAFAVEQIGDQLRFEKIFSALALIAQ